MKSSPQKAMMLAIAATTLCASSALAAHEPKPSFRINTENFAKLDPQEQALVLEVGARWEAIASMDRSALDRSDRRELRAEVKSLKAEARAINRGGTVIYLSSAAIIIIILLLILIL